VVALPRLRGGPPRALAAGIIALGAAACLVLNWPGQFSWDSVAQLAEGRSREYAGGHPPVMSWLLGLADEAAPGAVLFVVLDVALIYGALAALVLIGRKGSWIAVALAAAFVCFPQLAIYPAIVWKDVLFAGASCAGFTCLAYAAAMWTKPAVRWPLLGGALGLLSLAALTRQNGAVVLPFAGAAIGWMAARLGDGARPRRGIVYGLAFVAGAGAIVLAASAALATRVVSPHPIQSQWQNLQIYDLVGAVARDPKVELAVLHARAPWLETLLREGAGAYSPSRIDTLVDTVFEPMAGRGDVSELVAAQWRELVWRRPWLYLRVRAADFGWVLFTPRLSECVAVTTGVDGSPEELATDDLAERDTPRDTALSDYAGAFEPTPVYSHAAYGAVAVALLGWLLWRRRPSDIAVVAMLASALTFAASFALISIACDYRYLYALDVAAIAATLYAAGSTAPRRAPASG
jgi:hypothetical protein